MHHSFIRCIIKLDEKGIVDFINYMTPKQAGVVWDISERRAQALCADRKIKGARRLGGKVWLIPDASKPIDGRTKLAKCQNHDNKSLT